MLISALIAKISIIVLYILIIYGMAMLWKKFNKKPVAGGTIGFFVGLIPIMILFMIPKEVCVVNGEQDYSVYWAYGSATYEKQNGESIKLGCKMTESIFINDSKDSYMIEEVIYGFGPSNNITVKPMSHFLMDGGIDYFFDDEPPMQIEVEAGKYASRYWLRTTQSYESDYSF